MLFARHTNRPIRQLTPLAILLLVWGMIVTPSLAQDEALPVQLSAEYDIGFDCPSGAALDPDRTVIWVLMNNCGDADYWLQAYDVNSGEPVGEAYSGDGFAVMNGSYVDRFTTPIGFMPDGTLDIRYIETENYTVLNQRVQVDSGLTDQPSSESFTELARTFTDYPETTVFNHDHTQAVVIGETSLHVIGLTTEEAVFQLEMDAEPYSFFPAFSADGQQLFVAEFVNPDDFSDYTSVLTVYNLPDGEIADTYTIPSSFLWVSPDGRYVAILVDDNEAGDESVMIVELETGRMSDPLPMFEGRSKVMACANDGRDMSDVDFTTSGNLLAAGLVWLPDSSGFLTVNSYGGEGAYGGAVCYFNYSRLRRYDIQYTE